MFEGFATPTSQVSRMHGKRSPLMWSNSSTKGRGMWARISGAQRGRNEGSPSKQAAALTGMWQVRCFWPRMSPKKGTKRFVGY
jgi:hypothetical protein